MNLDVGRSGERKRDEVILCLFVVHLGLVSDSWEARQHRDVEGVLSPTRQLADKTIKAIKAIQEKSEQQ